MSNDWKVWVMNETSHWYIGGLFGLWAHIFVMPGLIGLERIGGHKAFIYYLIEYDEMQEKYSSQGICLLNYVDTQISSRILEQHS